MEVATMVAAPAWTRQYLVPGLELLDEQRERVLGQIRDLEASLASLDAEVQRRRATCDCLLAGEGPELVNAAQEILAEFGADVIRDGETAPLLCLRLRGSAGHKPTAVVLVTGGAGSVDRSRARLLADRLNELWEEYGDPRPKGILLANAFNLEDPRERHGQAFPEQIHSFCRHNDFCLLTTVQLFNAFFALRTGDLKDGEAFLESLLKTTLEYPKFRNCAAAVRG